MEGLCLGLTRTEVYRSRPPTFKETVKVVQMAEFDLPSARLGVKEGLSTLFELVDTRQ